ncbi:MAG: amidohydrolase family protein [Acidobacteriia bacterium]|nr:amidohydrolase family protein [Terriglobia bacterium]
MLTPWGDFPASDAHVHFFSRRFFATLGAQCGKSAEEAAGAAGWDLPPEDPAELARTWAAEMDRHGVARAALISSVPGDEASVIAAAAACPGRFHAFAMVNPLSGNATVAAGLEAVCLFPAMHLYSMADARVEPLLEQAAAAHCAVFVHCGVLTVGVRRKLGLPSTFDMRYSNPLDLHAVALRFPATPFLIPHFGAGYLREALMLADLCPNVYLDTSSSNSWMRYEGLELKTVFRRAIEAVGAWRLLFGTDSSFFPRGWNYEVFEAQVQALLALGISGEEARLILGENLERIFGGQAEQPAAG